MSTSACRNVIVLVALLGCGSKRDQPAPAAKAAPVDAHVDELPALEKMLDADLAALRALPCDRPVPHAPALDGPATDDILAITAPASSDVSACLDRMSLVANEQGQWLACEPAPSRVCTRAPVPETIRPAFDAIAKECGEPVAAAVARAVGHESACTPHVAGGAAGNPLRLILAARIAAHAALAQKPAAGLRRIVEVLQLGVDAARGGGGWIAEMAGLQTVRTASVYARELLRAPGLRDVELEAFADEWDRALASLPPLRDVFFGDPVEQIVSELRPAAKGQPYDAGPGAPESPQRALFVWKGVLTVRSALLAACAADATPAACLGALEPYVHPSSREPGDPVAQLAVVALQQVAATVRDAVRVIAEAYEVAIEIAVRRHRVRTGKCPLPPDVEDRLQPARLGLRMAIAVESDGSWRIDGPRGLSDRDVGQPVALGRVACTK